MKFIPLSFFLLVNLFSFSQTPFDSIFVDHLDTLKASTIKYHRAAALAELEQYNYKTKANWLYFVPSPGITLGAPTINYNLSNVAGAINAKHIKKATTDAILLRWQVLLNSSWSDIVISRESLINQIQAYNQSLPLLDVYQARFNIVQKGFDRNEVTPTEYLNAKLAIGQFINSLRSEYSGLVSLRNELRIKSKKGEPISLFLLDSHVSQ